MDGKTLNLNLHVRHLADEDEAKRVVDAVDEAVVDVIGRSPNGMDYTVEPDFDGPARTPEEQAQAAAEGRR